MCMSAPNGTELRTRPSSPGPNRGARQRGTGLDSLPLLVLCVLITHANGQKAVSVEGAGSARTGQAEQAADRDAGEAAFIGIREVTLGDPSPSDEDWRAHLTEDIYRKYSIGNWDLPRLRTYVDMLKAFGFNSIQLYDLWQRYANAGWAVWPKGEPWPTRADPRDWPGKMDAMADYARSQGMRTTLFIWGSAPFDYESDAIPHSLNLNDPAAVAVLRRYWDHQAKHAAHFDHLVTHWADPSGHDPETCSIETALGFHNEIAGRCRKVNPDIHSTFSLWMLHSERFLRWPGYKDERTVLDAGILPADVMIALDGNGGRIRVEQARRIAEAGRKAGVWGWYLVNNEISPSLHVQTSAVAAAFRRLPPEAHDLISWYAVDSNAHGLNMHDLYVAGKVMRDPDTDARAALREFFAGAFGVGNVARVEKVLRTIETTRGLWRYSGDPAAKLPAAREARALAREISIPEDFTPAFPMVLSPADLAEELVAQTEAIVQFLEFSAAVAKVEAMQKKGVAKDEVNNAIAKLPEVRAPTRWLTNFEYVPYVKKLRELGL